MDSRLVLFVGSRGTRIADMCGPLTEVARVVVATTSDILRDRGEAVESLPVERVLCASSWEDLLEELVLLDRRTRIDGALTFSEDVVETTARCCDQLGLRGQPIKTMPNFRDKYVQRRKLAEGGVATPSHASLAGPEGVAEALRSVRLPAMLKPTHGSGGALAHVVEREDPAELARLLDRMQRQKHLTGGAVEGDTDFILEELFVGAEWHSVSGLAPYVSVESLALDGELTHLAVTDRFPPAPPALETGMMVPSSLGADQRQRLVDAADEALRTLEFVHGAAHTELMLTADGPRVIEVNARVGGALPYLFPLASSVNLIAEAGKVALGQEPVRNPRFHGYAVFASPQHPVDTYVESVSGLDDVTALPGVHAVIPMALEGTYTHAFQHTMIAAVLASARTPDDGVRLWRQVMRLVRGEYAPADTSGATP